MRLVRIDAVSVSRERRGTSPKPTFGATEQPTGESTCTIPVTSPPRILAYDRYRHQRSPKPHHHDLMYLRGSPCPGTFFSPQKFAPSLCARSWNQAKMLEEAIDVASCLAASGDSPPPLLLISARMGAKKFPRSGELVGVPPFLWYEFIPPNNPQFLWISHRARIMEGERRRAHLL